MEAASKGALLLCLQPHGRLPPPVGQVVTAPHLLSPFTEGSLPPQSRLPLCPTPQGRRLPSLPPRYRATNFPPCPQVTGQPAGFIKIVPPPAPKAGTLNTSNTCSCSTTQNKVEKYILKHCFTSQSKNGQRLKIQFSRPFWSHLQISYDPDKEG